MIRLSTFDFLTQLAANNNREWFQLHKAEHDHARENILEFTADVISGLSKIDAVVPSDLDPKSCVMRIYRDVRFSKDKTPYKNNFGIAISANGKNFNGSGYYLHINPEQSFVAGGCWMPEPVMLKAIRQEIDYNGSDFRAIVENKSFKKYFGDLDTEAKLKTVPKGYPADHPDIEYLKLKSFTVSHEMKTEELSKPDAVKKVADGFAEMYPLIIFLRNAII
jgi:uncharacterized protein (TIGR02453 family)